MQKTPPLCGIRDDSSFPMLIRQIRDGLLYQIERQLVDSGLAINYSQHLVVKIIAKNGPQMPGDLARYLDHNAGAMTRLLDQLEDKGYVRRKPHAQDRRALTIELTPAGNELWRTNRAWQSTLMVVRQQAVAVVEDVLRAGVAADEFSAEIDVPLTASALVGMVLVAALDWQSFQPERSLDDVHAALSRLLQGRVSGRSGS